MLGVQCKHQHAHNDKADMLKFIWYNVYHGHKKRQGNLGTHRLSSDDNLASEGNIYR